MTALSSSPPTTSHQHAQPLALDKHGRCVSLNPGGEAGSWALPGWAMGARRGGTRVWPAFFSPSLCLGIQETLPHPCLTRGASSFLSSYGSPQRWAEDSSAVHERRAGLSCSPRAEVGVGQILFSAPRPERCSGRESSCGWGSCQLQAVLKWKPSLPRLLKWPPRPPHLQGPHPALEVAPSALHPPSLPVSAGPSAGSRPRRAHTAWSCVSFRRGLCVGPSTFLEGPVFLTAAFPAADTQQVPGKQEHVHGCWWCQASRDPAPWGGGWAAEG